MKKSEKEIKFIKKAAFIANSCLPYLEEILEKEKISEKEVSILLKKKIISLGGKLAFDILVASGKRSSKIHGKPSRKIISGIGYVDFGVSFKGYKVDVTVPFIKGKIGLREKKMVKTLFNVYRLAKKLIRVGASCFSVFEKVDDFLRKNGYRMEHSLGHGIGRKIHEPPTIGIPKQKLRRLKKEKIEELKNIVFENGMVFTIEPGIYVKNVGGCRIENTFLFWNNKLIQLTNSRFLKFK